MQRVPREVIVTSPDEKPFGSRIEGLIFRGVLTMAATSIGVNSYLVKDKVAEISADIRSMSISIRTLEVDRAVMGKEMESDAIRLDRQNDRIKALETSVGVLVGREEGRRGSRL